MKKKGMRKAITTFLRMVKLEDSKYLILRLNKAIKIKIVGVTEKIDIQIKETE